MPSYSNSFVPFSPWSDPDASSAHSGKAQVKPSHPEPCMDRRPKPSVVQTCDVGSATTSSSLQHLWLPGGSSRRLKFHKIRIQGGLDQKRRHADSNSPLPGAHYSPPSSESELLGGFRASAEPLCASVLHRAIDQLPEGRSMGDSTSLGDWTAVRRDSRLEMKQSTLIAERLCGREDGELCRLCPLNCLAPPFPSL
ncbi:uncharacterized protein [Vicugna pacos]|uniref:Uncharacterized protein isoform X2 n=1 Tax=Vicugna pacos TaxID=30538 RepID=A0ABM5DKT6_VICPA